MMQSEINEVLFLVWLSDQGFLSPRVLDEARWAAVLPLAYTSAVAIGPMFDRVSIDDRWCYETRQKALDALAAWDGSGEPVGWHRHPGTGRRVSLDPSERDETGKEVGAIGVLYRRP